MDEKKLHVAFGMLDISQGGRGPDWAAEVNLIIDIPKINFKASYEALKNGFIDAIKKKKIKNLSAGFFFSIVSKTQFAGRLEEKFYEEMEDIFKETRKQMKAKTKKLPKKKK